MAECNRAVMMFSDCVSEEGYIRHSMIFIRGSSRPKEAAVPANSGKVARELECRLGSNISTRQRTL